MVNALHSLTAAIIAAVFLVSGTAKVTHPSATLRVVRGFGFKVAVRTLTVALVVLELFAGWALLSGGLEFYGALTAGALGLIFAMVIAWNLARGRRPDCGCFGPLQSSSIGRGTLIRSVLLAAIAAWLAIADWRHGNSWPAFSLAHATHGSLAAGRLSALEIGLIVSLGTLLAISRKSVRGLDKQLRTLQATLGPLGVPGLRGITPNSLAPDFTATDFSGHDWALESLLAEGKPILLFFIDPKCHECRSLAADIAQWQVEHSQILNLVVISESGLDANERVFGDLGIKYLLLQQAHNVRDAYGCPATPGAIALNADGRAATPVAVGVHAVRELWIRRLQVLQSAIVEPATSSPEAAGALVS